MLDKLLEYQEKDRSLRKIEVELANSEEKKRAAAAWKIMDNAVDLINKLDVRAAELENIFNESKAELETVKEQMKEIENAAQTAEDETETGYLAKKSDELAAKMKYLTDKVVKLSDEIKSLINDFAQAQASRKKAAVEYKEYGAKYNELKSSKADEIAAIEKELAEIKKDVDPVLMERYSVKRKNKMFPIVFEVKGDICGACNMGLPSSDINKLKNGEVIDCETCGRMLYMADKK